MLRAVGGRGVLGLRMVGGWVVDGFVGVFGMWKVVGGCCGGILWWVGKVEEIVGCWCGMAQVCGVV